jgi:FG-GAP repeat
MQCIALYAVLGTSAAQVGEGAPTKVWQVHGERDADGFGASLTRLPDCNNDGVLDVVVGASNPLWESPLLRLATDQKTSPGYCLVLSGSNGHTLKVLRPEGDTIQFGHELCTLSSTDPKDQYLIVGSPKMPGMGQIVMGGGRGSGAIHVYSLPSLEFVAEHEITGEGQFGYAIAGVGQDLDKDGTQDLLVGAPSASESTGQAFVVSTKSGEILRRISPENDSPSFGWMVTLSPDCDSDGVPDFIISAPDDCTNKPFAGRITMYSGKSLSVVWTASGAAEYDNYGSQVSIWNDYDADGISDVIVSVTGDDTKGEGAGRVALLSSKTGQELVSLYGDHSEHSFGQAIDCGTDVDGCGARDALISASYVDGGYGGGNVRVFSGTRRESDLIIPGMQAVGLGEIAVDGRLEVLSSSVRFSSDDSTPKEFRRGTVTLWRIKHGE